MEAIVPLFVIILVAVVDLNAARNSSTYIDEDWIPQKPAIRDAISLLSDENKYRSKNRSAIDGLSPELQNDSSIKYLLITPSSVVRDVRHEIKKNQSEPLIGDQSPLSSTSDPDETPSVVDKTSFERKYKSSSHLRLSKTGDNQIVIRESDSEKSRTTRSVSGLSQLIVDESHGIQKKRQGKRGTGHRAERFLYDSNLKNDKLYTMSDRDSRMYKYHWDKTNADAGDRYYYSDFGSDEHFVHSDEAWRSFPEIFRRNQQNGPKRFQADSCRKYLEFLKYAFEQLDTTKRFYSDDQDEYFYYDEDLNKAEPKMLAKSYEIKPPPVITPDMAVFHSMAVTNYDTAPNTVEDSSVGGSYGSDTEKRSSELPEMKKSSTTSSSEFSSPLSFDVLGVRRETAENTEPTTGSQKQNVTESYKYLENTSSVSAKSKIPQSEKKQDRISEDCQDKLFPCPDNINVTYPVNGYCNRFVACEAGKPHSEFCQDGLHFNLVEKQCDLPHNSFCTYSCPTADGYFAIPGDCGGFFRCSNWYPQYRLCPPRMHWDNKAKICAFEELSACPLKCDSPYQVKPYSGMCNAYIVCTRNVPRYHQCPNGNHFDRKLLRCIPKLLSTCTDDEDYIARNRGIENGKKTLCADIELKEGGRARWCQETFEEPNI